METGLWFAKYQTPFFRVTDCPPAKGPIHAVIFWIAGRRPSHERVYMRGGIQSQLLLVAVLVCLAGMLAGCATTSETDTIQQNLAILNERQTAIESRIQNAEGASQRGGDMYARMEELQTRMRTLNGRLEELEHKLDQIQRAQASAARAGTATRGASTWTCHDGRSPAGFSAAQAAVSVCAPRAWWLQTGRCPAGCGSSEQECRAG